MTIRTLIIAASAALFLAGTPAFAQGSSNKDCEVLIEDVRSLNDDSNRFKAEAAYQRLVALIERNLGDLEGLRTASTEAQETEMLRKLSETNVALMKNKREFESHIKDVKGVLHKIRQSTCRLKDMTGRLGKDLASMLEVLSSTSARVDDSIERNNRALEYYDYLKKS